MEVKLGPKAQKYLDRKNEPEKSRIIKTLKKLEKEPPEGNIVPVTGQPGYFRLTIGNYRALFRYKEDYLFVTHLDPRGQVYNKKNKGGKR